MMLFNIFLVNNHVILSFCFESKNILKKKTARSYNQENRMRVYAEIKW